MNAHESPYGKIIRFPEMKKNKTINSSTFS